MKQQRQQVPPMVAYAVSNEKEGLQGAFLRPLAPKSGQ